MPRDAAAKSGTGWGSQGTWTEGEGGDGGLTAGKRGEGGEWGRGAMGGRGSQRHASGILMFIKNTFC